MPLAATLWAPACISLLSWHVLTWRLRRLHGLGYCDISHSGYVCDERWYSITYGIRWAGLVLGVRLCVLL